MREGYVDYERWGLPEDVEGMQLAQAAAKINHPLNSAQVILTLMLLHLYFSHRQAFAFYFIWVVRTQSANIPVSNSAGPLMLVQYVATEICASLRCVHAETELGNAWMRMRIYNHVIKSCKAVQLFR